MIFQRWSGRLLALVLLLGLIACGAPAPPFEPDVAGVVVAQVGAFNNPVVDNITLAPGSSVMYQVDVPARESDRDLLFVEIQGTPGLSVTLLSSRGVSLAAANDPRYFARRVGELSALSLSAFAGDEPLTPAVTVDFRCIGPCAAARATIGTFYLEVRNPLASSALVDLFSYLVAEGDPNEPNDFSPFATALPASGAIVGRIERVGDEDWFRYTGAVPRELRFESAASRLQLELSIAGGPTINPGQDTTVFPGEFVVVASRTGRAAAADDAAYSLIIGAQVSGGVLTVERSETPSATAVNIPAGSTRDYLVFLSDPADLLYVEAVGASASNLNVSLLTRAGTLLGVSRAKEFFADSVSALSVAESASAPLEGANLGSFRACIGPCVAIAGDRGSYVMRVHNVSGGAANISLYAFAVPAADLNDRGSNRNDSLYRATPLQVGSQFGAVEHLDDVDFYRYDGVTPRSMTFTAFDASLGLRLRFLDGLEFGPGAGPILLRPGDRFRVFPAANRAGPAAASGYLLEVSP